MALLNELEYTSSGFNDGEVEINPNGPSES